MAQKLQRDAEHNLQSFGQAGFDIIAGASDAVVLDGDWVAVGAVDGNKVKCTLTTTTGDAYSKDGTTTGGGLFIVSGQTIYGDFSSIKLAPGQAGLYVIAYRRVV